MIYRRILTLLWANINQATGPKKYDTPHQITPKKRRKTLNEIKIIEIFIKMEKKNIFKMKILDLINLFVILSPKIVKM